MFLKDKFIAKKTWVSELMKYLIVTFFIISLFFFAFVL